MLENAYLDAKIGVDTAENEARKERCAAAGSARTQGLPRERGEEALGAVRAARPAQRAHHRVVDLRSLPRPQFSPPRTETFLISAGQRLSMPHY